MLKSLNLEDLNGGIEFIDIGASGGFPRAWQSLLPLINYYAFEPNQEECERLRREPNEFNNAQYFPFAVADQTGEATLYKTRDMFCFSLLEPNQSLLDRYEFGQKFEVQGTEPMQTVRLGEVSELTNIDLDILKVDSQGLDRRILENAPELLERAFYVEVEPGFNDTYKTEDTYAGIDAFLRERGFRLFDLTPHRVGRNNRFVRKGDERGELLWAESVWIKDYVGLAQRGATPEITRSKALKCLLICAVEGRLDFGLELATWFAEQGVISADELASLEQEEAWQISPQEGDAAQETPAGLLATLILLLPWRLREKIYHAAQSSLNQRHLFKRKDV